MGSHAPSAVAEGIPLSVPTVNQEVVPGHQNATALRGTVPAARGHAWDGGRRNSAHLAEHFGARCAGERGIRTQEDAPGGDIGAAVEGKAEIDMGKGLAV